MLLLTIGIVLPMELSAESKRGRHKSVMLARHWLPSIEIKGWWMSEKLDGVRGCWTGSEMVSRSGKLLNVPSWFTRDFPPFPLDGELWIARGTFSELAGIVRSKNRDADWKRVSYYIFDVPVEGVAFEKRLETARQWFDKHPSKFGKVLQQTVCAGRQHLMEVLKEIEMSQGEGVMLRKPGSFYLSGRSRDILKVKTFHDAEAVVVGHIKGKGRNSERMGSIRVELPNGKRFLIGSGFTDLERETPPPVGSTITFKYKEINKSGIPRFASYLRVRQEL